MVGYCGLTLKQAAMTPLPEFIIRAKGREKRDRAEWEKVRWLAWQGWLHAPFIKRPPQSPTALLRFPDEKTALDEIKPDDCHISTEVEAVLNAIYNDFLTRKNDGLS